MILRGEIIPKKGIGNIFLGMSKQDVLTLIGAPNRETVKKRNRTEADYSNFSIIYSSSGFIEEIEIYPGAMITYKGKSIFDNDEIRKQMMIDDGCPFEISGVIVLLNLGVSIWGCDEDDDANKSITLFIEGTWNSLMQKMKPIAI